MALSTQQQISILQAYAPILLFHPEERYVPVHPVAFLRQSALWRGNATGTKEGWGLGGAGFPAFPRHPIIPRLGISLNPAEDVQGASDPDFDGVNEFYLGHKNKFGQDEFLRSIESERLWLDCAGWRDGDAVTQTSVNEACNLDALEQKFGPDATLLNTRHVCFGEVMEIQDVEQLLVSAAFGPTSVTNVIRDVLGEVWLVWYYFLYPAHEEFLRRCEAFFDKKSDGDYEGDWNAVAVIVRKPATLPWETPNPIFPIPDRVGYGVRLRGLAEDVADSEHLKQGMTTHEWKNIDPQPGTTHPRVYVSRGYHNNYAKPGDQVPRDPTMLGIELGKLACGIGEGASEVVKVINDTVNDVGDTAEDVALTLVKVLAGAAVGARFGVPLLGALGGLAAGLAEADASSADHEPSAEEWRRKEIEHAPARARYGLVITTADVPQPLIPDNNPVLNETADRVVQWFGDDASRLVDRAHQLWWPPNYEGHWGVQVQNDPMNRRSGIKFPDFRRSLLREVVESLAKG